jgi:phosphoenolpyruvate-protein phosphotransferase (PTS system enzyme I)
MTKQVLGIPASSGIAIGKVFVLDHHAPVIEKRVIENILEEIARLEDAVSKSKQDLEKIKEQTARNLGEEHASIFAAHLLILDDPEFIGAIQTKIEIERVNAEAAVEEVATQFITIFETMDNEYMKERAADIRDVIKRLTHYLLGISFSSPASISEESIIVAEDLSPSDTAQLDRQFVLGFATNIGGRTSHSAIMSRSLEIPAVVGTKNITEAVNQGDLLILDGIEGKVILNPSADDLETYKAKQDQYKKQQEEWAALKDEPTYTLDNIHVELGANIGNPDDLVGVLKNGGEGIGLYRTEFLYMGRNALPTEEEQFEAYKKVLVGMEGKQVVVRTLDIGGDKELPYLELPKEMNPFLGFRAIRLCLEEQTFFRTQLRALLRASLYGNLKIMFPMIATIDEFRSAKKIFEEEKAKLIREGIIVAEDIELGIMVEIPSTAMLADQFAKEVDFFSIGTNDLIQYTMAADRMNERVSYLYQPYNPAILRLIKNVINAAHYEGKWVGMCGEMAGDEIAIPLLIGLGLDELSMSATSILKARSQISHLSKYEMEKLSEIALTLSTSSEVIEMVKSVTKQT